MMTKEEHIAYWLKTADDNMDTIEILFKGKKYVDALFFGHLHLEKMCKANWVSFNNGNTPPFTHNLIKLLEGFDSGLSEDEMKFMAKMNEYQLEGRYPDYANALHKKTDFQFTNDYIIKIKNISKCLRTKL